MGISNERRKTCLLHAATKKRSITTSQGMGRQPFFSMAVYGSIEDWYEYSYVDGLKDRFQLILIDARAHGRSAKPYDEDQHSPELRAADVAAVIDRLDMEKCHFLGFSFGGRIDYPAFVNNRIRMKVEQITEI